MADFARWLHMSQDTIPGAVDLRAFAQIHAAEWPYYSNDVEDYAKVVDVLAPEQAAVLNRCLYRSFLSWRTEFGGNGARWPRLGSVALVAAGLVIGITLIASIRNPTFIALLADEKKARGLVTFLFAFATSAVIIVVTLGVLWVPKDEVEARFSKAKDILTILISVLGTILGFYFGSANPQPPLSPATSTTSPSRPAPAIAAPE